VLFIKNFFEKFRINESRYNMSKIKIAFFDIDGTILGFGKPDITEKTREALLGLKENGVKICIATGRSAINIPKFEGIDFDMIISFNGSLCMKGDEIIIEQAIPAEEVYRVINNATRMGRPFTCVMWQRLKWAVCSILLR